MPSTLALVTLGVNLAAACVCLLIGLRLARHPAEGVARRASTLFSVWWIALAVDMVLNAAPVLLALVGFTPPALIIAIAYMAVAAICVMFWGLVYYLVYLFTGREGAFVPVTAFYATTYALATAFIFSLGPTGADGGGGIAYANQPSAFAALLWALSLLIPPIVGSLAYGTLVFRVKHPFRRYRIALVSASMFTWFATAIVVNAPGGSDAMRATGIVIGILSLTGLVLAYFPPAALRRRLDTDRDPTLMHAVPGSVPDAALLPLVDKVAARAALAARARELI